MHIRLEATGLLQRRPQGAIADDHQLAAGRPHQSPGLEEGLHILFGGDPAHVEEHPFAAKGLTKPDQAGVVLGGRAPAIGIDAIGDHGQARLPDPQPGQHIGLELGKDNHPVEFGQGRGVELVGELLGPSAEVAQAGIKGWMEGGHQGHPQLLAEVRQAEIQGREGEAGVHHIGLEPLQGFAQFPLGPRRGDGVHLGLHQVGQGHLRVVGLPGGRSGAINRRGHRRALARDVELVPPLGQALGGVEVDEADAMAPLPQGLRRAQPVGDVAAEGRFLAQPGNVGHAAAGSIER